MRLRIAILATAFALVALVAAVTDAEVIRIRVDLPDMDEYRVVDSGSGCKLEFDACGYLMVPGKPMLPTKTFVVALPPGTVASAIDVETVGPDEIAGTYLLASCPMPVPLDRAEHHEPYLKEMARNCRLAASRTYASDEAYPPEMGSIMASGSLGQYRYVSVSVCPCRYHPQSGRLIRYDSAILAIKCEAVDGGEAGSGMGDVIYPDTGADRRARELLTNYGEIRDLYRPSGRDGDAPLETYDYVIITTSALSGAVTSSGFITWKQALGYNVRIVLITDPEITSQPGADLAEQIRNFLRAYYGTWGIEYVLMVGDYATVPMRYCYPDPTNHTNTAGTPGGTGGEVPTDYYYADLSDSDEASWDSDGDGYHGEYGEDTPDFMPEVYVGRIPVGISARITYALDKTVAFEQDTGAWKNSALHAGAFWYFTHELSDTSPAMDGAKFLSYIESDIMSGWTVSRYSEQSGLEKSVYPWPALTQAAFTGDWRTGQYAVVNWGAHGWTNSIARKIWEWDDGDGIPETDEFSWLDIVTTSSDLDDDYPSIVCAASCLVGCPEPNDWGRMGVKMLTGTSWGPSVGVISSARSPYGTADWPPGGSESIIYEFNDMMINGPEKVGQALYNSKFYCTTNYGWAHYAEYINMYTFNLFGDPSLTREGIDLSGVPPAARDGQVMDRAELLAGPSPARGMITMRYYLPSPNKCRLDIFDVLGRRVRSFEPLKSSPGWHAVEWDGHTDDGCAAASGIYWVRLMLPAETRTARIIRLR
jgi:hypothetical protein